MVNRVQVLEYAGIRELNRVPASLSTRDSKLRVRVPKTSMYLGEFGYLDAWILEARVGWDTRKLPECTSIHRNAFILMISPGHCEITPPLYLICKSRMIGQHLRRVRR